MGKKKEDRLNKNILRVELPQSNQIYYILPKLIEILENIKIISSLWEE